MTQDNKGRINTVSLHEVMCGNCEDAENDYFKLPDTGDRREFEDWVRSIGWAHSRATGWKCPTCVEEEQRG